MAMFIRYAQEIITPTLHRKTYLAGLDHNRVAQYIHDDLYARLLVFDAQGNTDIVENQSFPARIGLVSLDLIGLFRHHCQEIEQRVNLRFPGTRLIICCTHTHHGPDTMGLWGRHQLSSGVDRTYLADLKSKIVEMICGALSGPADPIAALRLATVEVAGVAKNARNPEILDQELTCLQFLLEHNNNLQPGATLIVFPCHPEVLWFGNPCITSDYPGFLRRSIELQTGMPCIFFSGSLGGMMTPDVRVHSFAEAEQMGNILAQAALQSLAHSGTDYRMDAMPSPFITCQQKQFTIPLTNPLFSFGMLIGLLPDLTDRRHQITTEANLLRIGPAWLVTAPGEVLPALGLQIKNELHKAGARVAAVIVLANDEIGYILPKEDFLFPRNPFRPGAHYEETNSIGPEAGPNLLSAVRALISTQ